MKQTQVAVLRSRMADLEEFEAFLAGLSIETSTRRFFAPTNRMPRSNARLLLTNDEKRGAFLAWHRGRVVAHACWATVAPGAAEIALVVADAVQRRGLGTRLAQLLLGDLCRAGLDRLEMVVEPGNRGVINLITRSWPDAQPRWEDGLLTYVASTDAEAAAA